MSDKSIRTIIQAHPGWDMVLPIYDGSKVIGVFYQPIIAWAIDFGPALGDEGPMLHFTTPITVEPNCGYETEIIRDPKGNLAETGNTSFIDEQEVIDRLQEVSDRWRRLEQKAAENERKKVRHV